MSFDRQAYMKKYNAKYRKENPEKIRKLNLDYKEKNKEELKKERRCYIERNKPKTISANRVRKLRQRYGINETEYYILYGSQEGKCKICGDFREILDVDHCHKTNEVRGLLCGDCNRGLGLFNDNVDKLKNAIKYLKN